MKLILASLLTSLALATPITKGAYPRGYIPFWSAQKGGYETALINTSQIVRIVPVYGENEKTGKKEVTHIQCYLTDGIMITIEEGFDDFYGRVRSAQIK